jgi:hypothetical protein
MISNGFETVEDHNVEGAAVVVAEAAEAAMEADTMAVVVKPMEVDMIATTEEDLHHSAVVVVVIPPITEVLPIGRTLVRTMADTMEVPTMTDQGSLMLVHTRAMTLDQDMSAMVVVDEVAVVAMVENQITIALAAVAAIAEVSLDVEDIKTTIIPKEAMDVKAVMTMAQVEVTAAMAALEVMEVMVAVVVAVMVVKTVVTHLEVAMVVVSRAADMDLIITSRAMVAVLTAAVEEVVETMEDLLVAVAVDMAAVDLAADMEADPAVTHHHLHITMVPNRRHPRSLDLHPSTTTVLLQGL